MDKEKAKFILGAYQEGLTDTQSPMVADGDEEMAAALEEARLDPELAAWLREQTEFDERVSKALRGLPVPEGLRQSILEGMELSAVKRNQADSWWRRPGVMWTAGLAAAALVAGTVYLPKLVTGDGTVLPGAGPEVVEAAYDDWQLSALGMLTEGFQLEVDRVYKPGLDKQFVSGWLMGRGLPVPETIFAKIQDEQLVGCFTVRKAEGAGTSTVCFKIADGSVVHAVTHKGPAAAGNAGTPLAATSPRLGTFGDLNTVSWREEGGKAIMLASKTTQEQLLDLVR